MIRVQSLTIKEFRGIRDFTVNFDGENFAICGPNGTGKSGVVDALEFALTGNISRLSGRGTGGISVREHAPHVDSRNRPDKARVILTGTIPSLGKNVKIERSVECPLEATITPADPDIIEAVGQIARRPEFALSRRELIRYVISTPGDRAKEVQTLLRLDEIENLRTLLQRIANTAQREVAPLSRARNEARDQLLRALEITELTSEKALQAVNTRRLLLGLPTLTSLTATTSLKDGLSTTATTDAKRRIPKVQAAADIAKLNEALSNLSSTEFREACQEIGQELASLNADPTIADGLTREQFLQTALTLFDNENCPVCDTPWDPPQLREHIAQKLTHLEAVRRQRDEAERKLEPVLAQLSTVTEALQTANRYASSFDPAISTTVVRQLAASYDATHKSLEAFLPLDRSIESLRTFEQIVPPAVTQEIAEIEKAISAIPEPSEQDAAREYLIVCQDRLEAYRNAALRLKQAEGRAELANNVSRTYATVATESLNAIYKQVEKDFVALYRLINKGDEDGFQAALTPSIGKLGFDVDFYGRGKFPPGVYHSEGHQDGMGVCLYLALMKHLLGASFTFSVLDDVLMSVDTGHRREVCSLLKTEFPNTQFVLTTHDEVWLRHMKTAGLIGSSSSIQFRKWDVAQGPTAWEDRNLWDEIAEYVAQGDVRAAAGLLRHYLEFVAADISTRLRARVEFRADGLYQLGDLLPPAISQFKRMLNRGKLAAQSWGQNSAVDSITARERDFADKVRASCVEQWQINAAVHYNSWSNLSAADFAPVVTNYRALMEAFSCAEPQCGSLFYLIPERGDTETLRCACGNTSINLVSKPRG
jgi:recombinational DNA repair ATPase RecF